MGKKHAEASKTKKGRGLKADLKHKAEVGVLERKLKKIELGSDFNMEEAGKCHLNPSHWCHILTVPTTLFAERKLAEAKGIAAPAQLVPSPWEAGMSDVAAALSEAPDDELEDDDAPRASASVSGSTSVQISRSASDEKLSPDISLEEGTQAAPPHEPTEVSAGEDDTMFGSILEEAPSNGDEVSNTTVSIRDMSLPKHFSGKSPRSLLEDLVRKQDKFARISFENLTPHSNAVRCSLYIVWDGGKVDHFEMKEESCRDIFQSQNYVSTMALYKLSTTPIHRQLPVVFKQLWDELEAKKHTEDERAYIEEIRYFKSIADSRRQTDQPPQGQNGKSAAAISVGDQDQVEETWTPPVMVQREPSATVQAEIVARLNWPTYQEMLVSLPGPFSSFLQERSGC